MFQILEFTEATLATLTPRVEKHGDDEKPAVYLGLAITMSGAVLDQIDKELRGRLFKHSDTKPLPGVTEAMTVLACNSIDRVLLPTKHEGWTLAVDDGIDQSDPMLFGSCKVDKFNVEPHQGGSVTLRFRVGTSDLDAARSGMLAMHVGRSIWITATPPKPGQEPKPKGKKPDATDLFAGRGPDDDQHDDSDGGNPDAGTATAKTAAKYRDDRTGSTWSGRGLQPKWLKVALASGKRLSDFEVKAPAAKLSKEPAWPFPTGERPAPVKQETRRAILPTDAWPFPTGGPKKSDAPPQHLTEPKVSKASRTARGKAKTAAHLAAGRP